MSRLSRLLLYLLLAWAPLPLASNRPIFWAINGALACLALILFALGEIGQHGRIDIDWRAPAIAAFAFTLVALWMIIQAMPGVPESLWHPVWTGVNGDAIAPGTISSSPASTWTTIAEVVPIGLLAVVAMRLATDRRRAAFLLGWIVAVATAIAAYGLVARALGFEQIFLVDSDAYPDSLTGTFIGRNAAATYFVVGIACATSLAAGRLEEIFGGSKSDGGWLRFVASLPPIVTLSVLADLVLAVALLNTGSRGGIIAGGVALVTIALVSLRRASAGRRMLAAAFAALFAAVLTVAAISSDLLLSRLGRGVTAGERLAVYRDTIDMILARPLLGHGAGAFIDAFPLYHLRAPAGVVWNRAHDTYLQTAAELGLPAFAVLVFGILVAVVAIFRGAVDRESPHPAAVAAVAVMAAVAFHSIVDFSVQIQAVGLTTAIVLGAGLGDALRRRRHVPRAYTSASEVAKAVNRREMINVTIPKAIRAARASAD